MNETPLMRKPAVVLFIIQEVNDLHLENEEQKNLKIQT